jgi:hypothetical protein
MLVHESNSGIKAQFKVCESGGMMASTQEEGKGQLAVLSADTPQGEASRVQLREAMDRV